MSRVELNGNGLDQARARATASSSSARGGSFSGTTALTSLARYGATFRGAKSTGNPGFPTEGCFLIDAQ